MSKRQWQSGVRIALAAAIILGGLAIAPAEAQVIRVSRSDARNLVGVNLGYFMLRGEDSRGGDEREDVLLANLDDLLFDVGDFNGATVNGEWVYGVSDYLEVAAGIGFYQKTVPSIYRNFEDSDGSEIEQDLKLRIVPITATVRFLPLPRGSAVEPYIGAGVGFFNWRYSETGEFIDFSDGTIFRDTFSADGNAVGPVIVAGLRFPVGDVWTFGGEYRWQRAEGDTDSAESGLLADKIDLGGQSIGFTFHFRF